MTAMAFSLCPTLLDENSTKPNYERDRPEVGAKTRGPEMEGREGRLDWLLRAILVFTAKAS